MILVCYVQNIKEIVQCSPEKYNEYGHEYQKIHLINIYSWMLLMRCAMTAREQILLQKLNNVLVHNFEVKLIKMKQDRKNKKNRAI
mgnify:CR=1 FL=1